MESVRENPFQPSCFLVGMELVSQRGGMALGVNIIGSCCGTTPEHTRAIRKMVDRYKRR